MQFQFCIKILFWHVLCLSRNEVQFDNMRVVPQGIGLQWFWNKCTSLQQDVNMPNSGTKTVSGTLFQNINHLLMKIKLITVSSFYIIWYEFCFYSNNFGVWKMQENESDVIHYTITFL